MSGRTFSLVAAAVITFAACSSTNSGVTDRASRPNESDQIAVGSDPLTTEGASSGTVSPSDAATGFDPAPVEWGEFNDAVDVATIDVPVDYAKPNGPRFELFVARFNALDPQQRIGSLLVNPGGPGFGGSDLALYAAQIYDRSLLERFDIIGWDPRGTGQSTPPIDCIDDYDPYFTEIDSTPESDAEHDVLVETAKDFARQCLGKNHDIIQHVGTNDSARDMDTIRRALGEDQISYFGFSYGSELGAAWATLFPATVRAAVLDGASDPEADALESELQQLAGFEASLATFLARCSDDSDCAFHNGGDAEGAFDALMTELDRRPVDSAPDRPPVNRDVALTAVAQAMYSETFWPALAESLADAQSGDGRGLLALNDSYYQRAPDGSYGNELEAFQAISCADIAERTSVEETDAESAQLTAVAPRLVPQGSAGGYWCTFFPTSISPRVGITGGGAGPIVVIGTTGDPATPFESTVRMADVLEDGRLVTVDADQHTGYGVNQCVIDVVNDYLIDLKPPADGTECR